MRWPCLLACLPCVFFSGACWVCVCMRGVWVARGVCGRLVYVRPRTSHTALLCALFWAGGDAQIVIVTRESQSIYN